jgi:hypothetical protein
MSSSASTTTPRRCQHRRQRRYSDASTDVAVNESRAKTPQQHKKLAGRRCCLAKCAVVQLAYTGIVHQQKEKTKHQQTPMMLKNPVDLLVSTEGRKNLTKFVLSSII